MRRLFQVSDECVSFGGNVSITAMIDQLRKIADSKSQCRSLANELVPHLLSVGSTPIRNVRHILT